MAIFDDPFTMAMLGMAQGFGQAAMPSPVRVPFGATLGMGMGGLAQGMTLYQKMMLAQEQRDHMRAQTEIDKAKAAREAALAPLYQSAIQSYLGEGQGGGAAISPVSSPVPAGSSPGFLPPAQTEGRAPPAGDPRDLAIRTVLAEAGGEGPQGMAAVAHVINNRVASGKWGKDAGSVVTAPLQFSPWNAGSTNDPRRFDPNSPSYQQAAQIYDAATGGQMPDPTGGALHFANPGASTASWVGRAMAGDPTNRTQIGNHVFFRGLDEGVPRGTQYASAGNVATDAAPDRNQQFFDNIQRPQPANPNIARADQLMRGARVMALVNPAMATNMREEAKMLLERGATQLTTVNGRPATVNSVTGAVQFHDEPVTRVTDPQGRTREVPRSQGGAQMSYGDAPSGYQWATDERGNITGLRPLSGGPAEFIIQEVQGPNGQITRYAIPRASLTGAPGAAPAPAPGQQGGMAPPAAPTSLAQAPVNLQAPSAPAPAWAPSGGVLQPPEPRAVAVPPGSVALGASGKPDSNPAGLEPGTKKEVEAGLLESQNALSGMNRVREQFRPEFLQTTTRLGNWWNSVRDRTPEVFGKLNQAQQAQLQDYTRFRASAWQDLNGVIKDQSGAAVTVSEMERMLKARPNPGTGVFDGDSPTEFKAKMDEVLAMKQNAILRHAWALRRGPNPMDPTSGVTLDQVPKLMAEEINKAQREIAAQNPDMTDTALLAAARRKVGMDLGLGTLR